MRFVISFAVSQRAAARARSRFAWNAKALQTMEVYRWVLGRRADKPDNAIPFPDTEPAGALMPEPEIAG